jgi:hypothetical protein
MALLGVLSLAVAGCGLGTATGDKAAVLMRIVNVEADAGGMNLGFTSTLQSDVLWIDPQDPTKSSIFPDIGRLTIMVEPKNPDLALVSPGYSDVVLERYEVVYKRTDGRNTEGVDVPFRITGPMAARAPVNATSLVTFEVVRHAAKLEPPLMNLAPGAGENMIITCYAEITVHGRTISGQAVSDMKRLQITFANFAN